MSLTLGLLIMGMKAEAGTIYNSPYVSFSPDGQAWTTNAGDTNVVWYAEDGSDDVQVYGQRTLPECKVGEHYYAYKRSGTIPVAQWKVGLSKVNCCHNAYPSANQYHGVNFVKQTCGKPHFSAWYPICADCGNPIVKWNFYMSKQAVRSLDYLEFGRNIYYYYLCPFNKNLEQGVEMLSHNCRKISANQYRVVYEANANGEIYSGYMAPSAHMYDNATEYEGRRVTPQTHLSPNTYGRIGWEFEGWNTMPDGTGTFYEDEAEILNLCDADYLQDEEKGTVILYAVWKKSQSILEIDPAGGYYFWHGDIVEISGEYGSDTIVDSDELTPPDGYRVTFDFCGVKPVDYTIGRKVFAGWKQSSPFEGKLYGEQYFFLGPDGNRDRLTATYELEPIILPEVRRDNYSFGGWYYDKEYQRKAGDANEEYTPTRDVTLYAQWVELRLESYEMSLNKNYDESVGAVNLSWSQEDGRRKTYKIYQCPAGRDWKQIYTMDTWWSGNVETDIQEEYTYCRGAQYFTVPITGFYSIEAYGAQGCGNDLYTGGLGGLVKGSFWLEQGQTLEIRVGGQDTFYGGGSFGWEADSQNGGDYTAILLGDTLLAMAGGGGGAGKAGNGGAGGLSTSLLETGCEGECGGSGGGGGGYLGGRAGELVAHFHETGVCNHVHEGNPSVKGGCYTKEIKCGQSLSHKHTRTEYWSWGGSDESYCPNCGADASKGETCSGHSTKYYSHTCSVHGKQASNTSSSKPEKCSTVTGYEADCGKNEEYICGYPYDGYVISSGCSYGGNSYINESYVRSYTKTPGVWEGVGYVMIKAEDVGYWDETYLNAVGAPDKASPREVDIEKIKKIPAEDSSVIVRWERPQDLGTLYYHKAESYLTGSDKVLSVSNITADTIVSGVLGYWYLFDGYAGTEINGSNGEFMENPWEQGELEIALTEEEQFLHIKVQDFAGNCSNTVHIPLGSLAGGNEGVKWPVLTKPLGIEASESVYLNSQTGDFYVKCDGITPFIMNYNARMQGIATDAYQINYAVTESMGEENVLVRNSAYVPSCSVEAGNQTLRAEDMRLTADGEGYLQNENYIVAERSNACKDLAMKREFVLSRTAHGERIRVIPIAGADDGDRVHYSDYEKDKENGLWIVGDGQAPVIKGLEVLENLPVLDRRTQDICLQVTAMDELSGVQNFYITIENLDNGAKGTYLPGANGAIEVNICADEAIFSGDFTVTAYAADNVGNVNSLTYGTTEFDLQVSLERILEPHAPVFKCGESGILNISSWGYAERIEVEFPKELTVCNPELDQVYEYELKGAYLQQEQLTFMIPLDAPEGRDYTVTVRAYKGDKMLERHPALAVLGVSGNVLDELRTRLR